MGPSKKYKKINLPAAGIGNQKSIQVVQYGPKSALKKAYLQAGLHADEPPGFLVMHYLLNLLDQADKAGRIQNQIWLVPVANPIGLNQWQGDLLTGRFEFFNQTNFNRSFADITVQLAEKIKGKLSNDAAKNVQLIKKQVTNIIAKMKPLSEGSFLKLQLLKMAIDADIVLDLHCDAISMMHIYTGTPLWPEASDLSAQMQSDLTILAKNSGGEPFDEACSRLWWDMADLYPNYPIPPACLSATVELRGQGDVSHEFAKTDAQNLFLFLQRRGFIKGKSASLPKMKHEATPLAGVEQVEAPCEGIVVYRRKVGEYVKKGEVIADIMNPLIKDFEKRLTVVKAGIDGLLFSTQIDRYARPGRTLAKIAGTKPIPGKGKYLLQM